MAPQQGKSWSSAFHISVQCWDLTWEQCAVRCRILNFCFCYLRFIVEKDALNNFEELSLQVTLKKIEYQKVKLIYDIDSLFAKPDI